MCFCGVYIREWETELKIEFCFPVLVMMSMITMQLLYFATTMLHSPNIVIN